jgi:hypothetical protein
MAQMEKVSAEWGLLSLGYNLKHDARNVDAASCEIFGEVKSKSSE